MTAGDPLDCAGVARTLQRSAAALAQEVTELERAVPPQTAWSGVAADGYSTAIGVQARYARNVADRLAAAGRGLAVFAGELTQAQQQERRAAALPSCNPADPSDPRPAQERARSLLCAQDAAERAHERLSGALRPLLAASIGPVLPGTAAGSEGPRLDPPSRVDLVDLVNGLLVAPRALADRTALKADLAGSYARSLRDATRLGSHAEQAAARADWRAALRDYRELRRVQQASANLAGKVPNLRWLATLNAPLARTAPVLRHIPVASVVLVGTGTYMDHANGMSVGLAATKNVGSAAAGMAAYSAATPLLLQAGLVGGPVVLGAVLAGFAVSWGVGQVIEHYGDDISAAAGAVADGVVDFAQDAGGAVSDAWQSVFG